MENLIPLLATVSLMAVGLLQYIKSSTISNADEQKDLFSQWKESEIAIIKKTREVSALNEEVSRLNNKIGVYETRIKTISYQYKRVLHTNNRLKKELKSLKPPRS